MIHFLEHQISLMLEEARFLVDINVHSAVDSLARRAFCKLFSSACLFPANPSCLLHDNLDWASFHHVALLTLGMSTPTLDNNLQFQNDSKVKA